jgi:homoserine O-succinyltransferase
MKPGSPTPDGEPLVIGLVNNMPDGAFAATERQFTGLLEAAAGEHVVRVRLFSLPEIVRGEHTRAQMRGRYDDIDALPHAGLDALIVTGTEPRTADLADEAYWPSLTRLIDWAQTSTLSTVWSCLAAHAAVLHLDGVRRRPLPAKLSGVFRCERTAPDPILAGLPVEVLTPHSRQNELSESDLTAAGYDVLTRSDDAGVDLFVRRGQSLFVFLQGHPEYDADSLLREYGRDVARFLKGDRPHHPPLPAGYFSREVEQRLAALADEAARGRSRGLMDRYMAAITAEPPAQTWRPGAQQIYANWLDHLATEKARRAGPLLARAVGA